MLVPAQEAPPVREPRPEPDSPKGDHYASVVVVDDVLASSADGVHVGREGRRLACRAHIPAMVMAVLMQMVLRRGRLRGRHRWAEDVVTDVR
jgi:hypothetical protein